MQLVQQSKSSTILCLALAVVSGAIWQSNLNWILLIPYLSWGALAALLIVIISPIGNIKLNSRQKPHKNHTTYKISYQKLQINIILIQACLLGILYCLYTLSNHLFLPRHILMQHSFISHITYQLKHNFLFPWPIICFLSLLLCYQTHKKNQAASIQTIVNHKDSANPLSANNILLDLSSRICCMVAIASCIAITLLFCSEYLLSYFGSHLLHGITAYSLMFIFTCFVIIISKRVKTAIKMAVKSSKNHLRVIYLSIFLSFTVIILLNLIIPYIFSTNIVKPQTWLTLNTWQTYWHCLSILWWMLWCVPLGLWQTQVAAGFRLRTIVIAQLLAPAVLLGGYELVTHLHPHLTQLRNVADPLHAWQLIIGIVSCTLLMVCFTHGDRIHLIFNAKLMPSNTVKQRHAAKPVYILLLATAAIATSFLQTGFKSLSFVLSVQVIPLLLSIMIALLLWPCQQLWNKLKKKLRIAKLSRLTASSK